MKTLIYSVVLLFPIILKAQIDTTFSEVYFKKGKWTISEVEKSKLQFIDKNNAFTLAGFTDADADSIFNYELSKKRVTEIENYLIEKGVDQKYISKYYYGEKDADSKDMYSRRVEVYSYEYIDSSKIKPVMSSVVSDTVINQLFTINTTKDTTLMCAEGTNITIEAGTFKEKNVVVQVKEYYDMDDIILANLATVSNGKMLESKGMIYINATANNTTVFPQKPINIAMKNDSDTLAEGFKIFSGMQDAHGNINWNLRKNTRLNNKPNYTIIQSNFNFKNKLRHYLDNEITKSMRNGYKEEYLNCRNYKNRASRIKTFLKVDEDGNMSLIDKNYVVQDTLINKGRKYFINGKWNRYCYDYCNEIILSLSPLPEKYQPNYTVISKYYYLQYLFPYNYRKNVRIPQVNKTIAFPTLTMGWINCDKFIDNKDPVLVKVDNRDSLTVVMIAKEKKSLLNSYSTDNKYAYFNNIPNALDIIVFGYKINADNTYSFSFKDAIADDLLIHLPQPEILTEQEFKERLKTFN